MSETESSTATGDSTKIGKLTLSKPHTEIGAQEGLCLYTEGDFRGAANSFVNLPQSTCLPIGPPATSGCNHSGYQVHFYRDACYQRPYFALENGECSSNFPFPVRWIVIEN